MTDLQLLERLALIMAGIWALQIVVAIGLLWWANGRSTSIPRPSPFGSDPAQTPSSSTPPTPPRDKGNF